MVFRTILIVDFFQPNNNADTSESRKVAHEERSFHLSLYKLRRFSCDKCARILQEKRKRLSTDQMLASLNMRCENLVQRGNTNIYGTPSIKYASFDSSWNRAPDTGGNKTDPDPVKPASNQTNEAGEPGNSHNPLVSANMDNRANCLQKSRDILHSIQEKDWTEACRTMNFCAPL